MITQGHHKDAGSDHIKRLVASRVEGHGLPRAFYHDRELYEFELERIWRRGWIFVGHVCQIPQPGDYLTFGLGDDSVIVVRDDDTLRAFHNVCRHRGTLLCDQEQGHARAFVCPYHQWTYSRRGELVACRGMQEDIDADQLGLLPLHTESCAGLIFVSLAEAPPEFPPARDLMAPFAAPQGLERAKVAHVVDYMVRANWKLIWENNRECYHCNVCHPQYIKSNFDIFEDEYAPEHIRQSLTEALQASEVAWEAEGLAASHKEGGLAAFPDAEHNIWYSANRTLLRGGYQSESMNGCRVAPLMGSYRDAGVGVLRLRTLPNFWNHASCDHAVTTRLLPAGLHLTRVRLSWLVDEEAQEGADYDLGNLLPFWKTTSEQDWELCERVQRGVRSPAFRPGPLSRDREYNLEAFLKWYLRQLQ
jgi:glycine betaine catabolism A